MRVRLEKSHDEFLGLLADILPIPLVKDDSTIFTLVDEICKVLASEWRVTAEKGICNDTHRPHVDWLAMSPLEHDFGSCVAERSSHGLEDAIGRV